MLTRIRKWAILLIAGIFFTLPLFRASWVVRLVSAETSILKIPSKTESPSWGWGSGEGV